MRIRQATWRWALVLIMWMALPAASQARVLTCGAYQEGGVCSEAYIDNLCQSVLFKLPGLLHVLVRKHST